MISIIQFNTAKLPLCWWYKSFSYNTSVVNLNKLVNRDIKHLNNWFSANKISLNVEKTELVIYKSSRKVLPNKIKVKLKS